MIEVIAAHDRHVVYLSAEAAAADPQSFWAVVERLVEQSATAGWCEHRIIGEAIGRPVHWEEGSREDARAGLVEFFGDESFAEASLDTWAGFVTTPERVTSTVQDLTGVPARQFRQWATDHAGEFR